MIRAIFMPQQAVEQVKHNHRARIANMGKVIDRRPADIHAHIFQVYGRKILLCAGECIVELERHKNPCAAARASGFLRQDSSSQRMC